MGKRKTQPKTNSTKGKYLYCIIKESTPKKFNILGQERRKIYVVNERNLAVVVSDTPKEEYLLLKEYLVTHEKVIEEVMKQRYDVLPISFGTVAASAQEIREKILKPKRKELLAIFKTVKGKIELGLRVFWEDMPHIFQEIVAENKEIQRAKREAQRNPNQFRIAGVGELVQKTLEAKRQREAQKILAPLKKLAADFKERQVIKHGDIMKDAMILHSAFLVAKKNEKEFDKRVEALAKEYGQRVKFRYVGPIPPFNFVSLQL